MPAYWSLGFHLCRYGYRNIAEVQKVLKRNQQAGIPQVNFVLPKYIHIKL